MKKNIQNLQKQHQNNNKTKNNQFKLKLKRLPYKLMMMMIFKNNLIKQSIKINQQLKTRNPKNDYYKNK